MTTKDADFDLMPPLFQLDDYEECFKDPEGLYCTADFAMVSDRPSPLLTMMQEYSGHVPTNFNHTLLRRGLCITQTCKQFYKASELDLGSILEACANEIFYNNYKLNARVLNGFACSKREKNQPIDYLDLAVSLICLAILITNIVASICDYIFEKGKYYKGLRYLYCFSIFRNWRKLVAPPADASEPRLLRLRGLHGIRALTMFLVIVGHSFIFSVFAIEDSRFIENLLIAKPMHIIMNGTLIMQTFLLISSFLLVYKCLIYSEKHEPSWKMLPKLVIMRWLRLTPSYAVLLGLTATWFGRLTTGPYWQQAVGNELSDCRRDWWKHLLYINNYSDDSECMIQAWYLAADTQLYCMAAILFIVCRTADSRKIVLSILFVLGLIIPTLHTYYQNLDGILMVTPESSLDFFKNSPTFHNTYKRAHTNLTGYVIGMAMGYWVYEWQKSGGDPKSIRKHRFFFWSVVPLGVLCCYSGNMFYTYPRPSLIINLLYAAFIKPVFATLVGICMVGIIIQLEDMYRAILEWSVWTIPSRLSFCAYLLHTVFVRNYMASRTTTARDSAMLLTTRGIALIISSYTAAFFFWILVEGPVGNVIRVYFTNPEINEADNSSKRKEHAKIKKD